MTFWTLWNDTGKLSDEGIYTETDARDLIRADSTGTVYAENSAGDCIYDHDGPIFVAKTPQ